MLTFLYEEVDLPPKGFLSLLCLESTKTSQILANRSAVNKEIGGNSKEANCLQYMGKGEDQI